MVLPYIAPRRVVPYLISGASGVHVLARMWQLSKLPATDIPLHIFLFNHTDVILVLGSAPIVWHLTQRQHRHTAHRSLGADQSTQTTIPRIAHRLRQVFTVILLGLGLIRHKASGKGSHDIQRLVE